MGFRVFICVVSSDTVDYPDGSFLHERSPILKILAVICWGCLGVSAEKNSTARRSTRKKLSQMKLRYR